jgi:two-component system chemotaxis response regulator CheB
MPAPLRVIIATTSPLAQSRLARDLATLPEVDLRGRAQDLSGIYMLAEQQEPEIALIGRDLLQHADFEGILSLFGLIGTACIEILPGPAQAGAAPGAAPQGAPGIGQGTAQGIAQGIAPGMAAPLLLAQLRAAHRSARTHLPGPLPAAPAKARRFRADSVILIGASTGGIDALLQILSALPADCPPTAIVQHTGAAFSGSLIRLLGRCTKARILAAAEDIALQPGTIVVGAGCRGHLQLRPGPALQTQILAGGPVSGHMPSVDMLFRSALPIAPRVVAALLTGMGRDGAQGLLELRRAGARTLAQDQASSVVFGMPRAAAELGAAEQILPLDQIAARLLDLCLERRMEANRR